MIIALALFKWHAHNYYDDVDHVLCSSSCYTFRLLSCIRLTDSEEGKRSLPTLWEKAEEGLLQATTIAEKPSENGESQGKTTKKEPSEKHFSGSSKVRDKWKRAVNLSLEESESAHEADKRKGSANASIGVNLSGRQVWRPKQQPRLADLVASLSSQKKQRQARCTSPPLSPTKISLQSRQQMLQSRVQDRVHTTQTFFEEGILENKGSITSKPLSKFKEASKRVLADVQRNRTQSQGSVDLADVVSQYLAKMRAERDIQNDTKSSQAANGVSTHRGSHMEFHKRLSAQSASDKREPEDKPGTIPLDRWCKIVRKNKVSQIRARTAMETEV